MWSVTQLYITYSIISIIIPSILVNLFWRRRKSVGSLSMFILMLFAVEWALFYLLSALNTDYQSKIFWDNLTFIGVVFTPVLWFIFSIQYTRQEKLLKARFYHMLCILPLTTLTLLFTDHEHGLFIAGRTLIQLPNSSISLITYQYGIWFWVHFVYSYGLMLLGIFFLLKGLISSFKIYRNQALIMITAIFIPVVGSLLYLSELGPFKYLDPTTLTFSLAGLLLFIGMFRYRALDLVPIARDAVIETMSDGVIVLDSLDRIIDINHSAKGLLSDFHGTLIGSPIVAVSEDICGLLKQTKNEAKILSNNVRQMQIKDKHYKISISPLQDKKKTYVGSFIVLNDITDLTAAMEKLERAKLIAESSSKAKSNFLATMSHEIRTPINGIIGMSELLESASLQPQERDNLKALQDSADSLLHLINEILDFSKIEAGKMEVESIRFNLRDLMDSITSAFRYNSQSKAIAFTCHIDHDIPQYLIGDNMRLRQILVNLLSNSFKFTDEGAVHIQIEPREASAEGTILGFTVSDTGIGISPDKIKSLFESFHQLDSSTTRKYGGTGLGLSIVKRLVELMGGVISVKSTYGKGSSFYFELPFKQAQDVANAETAIAIDIDDNHDKLRILVGEDSKVNQLLITQLLAKRGWTSDIAVNGKELLLKLQQNSYDLILMDIQMPEMDGYEATAAIRSLEAGTVNHIPIIALTANATEEDRKLCLQHGMDDFLSKPIKSKDLYTCILQHINGNNAEQNE